MRINKYIASSGICSRRKAEEYILNGDIKVNNKVIKELSYTVNLEKDIVKFKDKIIKVEDEKVYYILNKPRGYVVTLKDEKDRKCVTDLIKEDKRIFPIGRLDRDSEGLIILTNDGDFTNEVIHPSKKVEKEYEVKITGELTEEKIKNMETGIEIDGYLTKPAKIKNVSENTFNIVIKEGRNRQIRKMCEKVKLDVKKLKRIRIGKLRMEDLKSGQYKKIDKPNI